MQEQQALDNPPLVAEQPGSTPASPGVTDATLEGGTSNPVVLDAVGEGTPEATTESVEHAVEGEHHEVFLGLDSYGWVALSFVIFVAVLLWLKVPKAIAGALDGRAARIKAELDEARRLKDEAQALLAQYQSKRQEAEREAEGIIAGATAEAERMAIEARTKMEEFVTRRTKLAETKIAQAEAQALAEVRSIAADAAVAAAEKILTQTAKGQVAQDLLAQGIDDVRKKLN